jgi:hypothetical protein
MGVSHEEPGINDLVLDLLRALFVRRGATNAASPEALGWERMRKMVTKRLGTAYFHLPTSSDPESAVYDHIRSVADLDNMTDDLFPEDDDRSGG